METLVNAFLTSWSSFVGYAIMALVFGLISFSFMGKDEGKFIAKHALLVGMVFSLIGVYQKYTLLKEHPEDIAFLTNEKLAKNLYDEYVSDCSRTGESNTWNIDDAHVYYQRLRHFADVERRQQEEPEFWANHELIWARPTFYGQSLEFENKKTGKLVTRGYISDQFKFWCNYELISVDGESVVCRNVKTGELVTLEREIRPLTNWESI